LAERTSSLYGIDSDERGLEILRSRGFGDLFIGDLESLDECELDETFDVVVAGEMIEHLNNPGLFLAGVKRFLTKDSKLLITTINAYCAMRYFLYAVRGKGGTNEPVHPDHVAYYSFSTLSLLLERHGFADPKILFYALGDEHRPHNRWIVNAVNDMSTMLFPHFSDGLIAECRL
jgi:SAM-dependent methyltransferase